MEAFKQKSHMTRFVVREQGDVGFDAGRFMT